ncbi:MAG: translation initiation factor IF-1 [Candidatus Sungbacteria bacterium]|nr:translation initiation factor IF-1 [Candidatus Sungbacteria bacterium]
MASQEMNRDSKENKTYVEGVVTENLPNTRFRIELADGRTILGYLSGKMRLHYIKVLPGDRVRIEMSPYDQTKGRIILRMK